MLSLSEMGTWLDRLIEPIGGFVSLHPLPEETHRRFPDLVSIERLGDGTTALAILRKRE